MASLQKKSGRWYVVYNDAAGKQKWVKGYSEKTETQRLANQLENEKTNIQRGDFDPLQAHRRAERGRSVDEHIKDYRAHLDAKGSSQNHVEYTIGDIEKCFEHAAVKLVTGLTSGHIDRWVLSLKGKDAPRTINRRVGSVQSFLRNLARQGICEYVLEKYPKQRVQGTEKRKRRALTEAEVTSLLSKTPEPRKLIYRFALLTGLRYSEIESLTPDNFNFSQKTLTVFANDAKNKRKHQTIPLHPALIKPVKALLNGREHVFTLPSRSEAAKTIRSDCEAAKVDTTSVDFHGLRHTYITRLAEKMIHPKILQDLARHSNIDTTLRYYVHFRQADERAAIESLKV